MFDSAATELIKKTVFFLKCSVLGDSGFIFRCPLRCLAQLGGRLATVCLPSLRPAVEWFTLFLQALLWSPPQVSTAVESLHCSVLPRQRQAASAVDVYLSRDGLPRQRLAASAVGVYLSWGGLPWSWWTPLPHRASRTVCSG